MKKIRRIGFTMVEVSLFLAITAAIFVGVAIGTQNTVWHQKLDDSVQNFAEFMRGIYSQVSNTQGIGSGQSEQAIYGKLVVFGQSNGIEDDYAKIEDTESHVFVYDVVGNADGIGSGKIIDMLRSDSIHANVVIEIQDSSGNLAKVVPAGIVQSYVPKWMATIEQVQFDGFGHPAQFKGSILVIRHPRSGTINTLVSTTPIEVNRFIHDANSDISHTNINTVKNFFVNQLGAVSFSTQQLDFCINLNGQDTYSGSPRDLLRRDIRLVSNARNASGVEVIDLDTEDNLCRY